MGRETARDAVRTRQQAIRVLEAAAMIGWWACERKAKK